MRDKIKSIINKVGIKDVGFCAYNKVSEKLIECRAKQRLPKNAKTVIVCLFPYKVKELPPENISRYAAVPDYHKICGEYLERATAELRKHIDGYQFEFFIDNSPLPEVYTAAVAGLGVIGENELLITEDYGSYVFVGEIVTDFQLDLNETAPKYCNACGKCKTVCPKYTEKSECLSKISQKKGELSPLEVELLRKHKIIWGCDICMEVCPQNQNAKTTYIKEFIDGYRNRYTEGEDIKMRAYEWRGEKTVQRNYLLQKEKP